MKQYSHNLTLHARSLRLRGTPAEHILWQYLRRHALGGLKFKRQHRIGRYIVDFYCGEYKLVVELEGGIHQKDSQRAYDEERFEHFRSAGYHILRIRNEEVLENMKGVLRTILERVQEPSPRNPSPKFGRGDVTQ
ncbi:MAG: DUF559 domain-containing protein [Ignavibacteriae bacterium]|nr:DUF559 domain-containing protein [Ignavibacteriota bacterium]